MGLGLCFVPAAVVTDRKDTEGIGADDQDTGWVCAGDELPCGDVVDAVTHAGRSLVINSVPYPAATDLGVVAGIQNAEDSAISAHTRCILQPLVVESRYHLSLVGDAQTSCSRGPPYSVTITPGCPYDALISRSVSLV